MNKDLKFLIESIEEVSDFNNKIFYDPNYDDDDMILFLLRNINDQLDKCKYKLDYYIRNNENGSRGINNRYLITSE